VQIPHLHDTPARELPRAPLGMGVFWMVQALPFQRSASGTVVPALLVYDPTAVHADADVHDTPARELPCAPLGLGVDWTAHVLPFQRMASISPVPLGLETVPPAL
jgi:hypothetical protein